MTRQTELFATPGDDAADLEARKLARGGDPRTSHDAARWLVRTGLQSNQKALCLSALTAFIDLRGYPPTSAELADWFRDNAAAAGVDPRALNRPACARRLSDLSKDSKVAQGPSRPCRSTGRGAVTWRVRT